MSFRDIGPDMQAVLGRRSGASRRAAVADRDREIVYLHLQGKSLREIARKVGLSSHTSVGKVLQRDAAAVRSLPSAGSGSGS